MFLVSQHYRAAGLFGGRGTRTKKIGFWAGFFLL